MLSWIPSCLKIFLEKYFITTIISLLGAIAATAFTPENCWLVNKLGAWYYIGIFCGCFLSSYSVKYCWQNIKVKIKTRQAKLSYEQKEAENIMTLFDLCSPKELIMAYTLLEQKNAPMKCHFSCIYKEYYNWSFIEYLDYHELNDYTLLFKFKDHFYKKLQKVYSKYGRISHFARDTQ